MCRKNKNLHQDNHFWCQQWEVLNNKWLQSQTWRKTNQDMKMWLQTRITNKDKEIKVRTTSQVQLPIRPKAFKAMDTSHSMLNKDLETSPIMWGSTGGSMWEIFLMMLIDISSIRKLKTSRLITEGDMFQDQSDQALLREWLSLLRFLNQESWLVQFKRLSSMHLLSVTMSSIESRESKESIKSILKFKMSIKNSLKWLRLAKESEKE